MSSPSIVADREPFRAGIPRPVETALALAGLLLCSPLLGLTAVVLRVTSPGPILFRQRRVGRGGVEFTLFKFRTMRVHGTGHGVTADGDPRITRLGRWLRRAKLDELPELWNVARGEMSLVGPRPEVPRYVDMTNPLWLRVLEARPGITDPVTLRLRNEEQLIAAAAAGDIERFYLETLQPYKLVAYLDYLRHRSLRADVGVLLRTLLAVVFPDMAAPPTIDEIRAASAESSRSISGTHPPPNP
jgi:lipopolysaccharide/colanic/teichoic acid biosynthesis glycosyltransferase